MDDFYEKLEQRIGKSNWRIGNLVRRMYDARIAKNYARSDRIRGHLAKYGIEIRIYKDGFIQHSDACLGRVDRWVPCRPLDWFDRKYEK